MMVPVRGRVPCRFLEKANVDTVYFWELLNARPQGDSQGSGAGRPLIIGLLPKEWMDRMRLPADLHEPNVDRSGPAIQEAGFRIIRIEKPQPAQHG